MCYLLNAVAPYRPVRTPLFMQLHRIDLPERHYAAASYIPVQAPLCLGAVSTCVIYFMQLRRISLCARLNKSAPFRPVQALQYS